MILFSTNTVFADCYAENHEHSKNKFAPAEIEIISLAGEQGYKVVFPETYKNHEFTNGFVVFKEKEDLSIREEILPTLVNGKYLTSITGHHDSGTVYVRYGECFVVVRPISSHNNPLKFAPSGPDA